MGGRLPERLRLSAIENLLVENAEDGVATTEVAGVAVGIMEGVRELPA